MIMSGLRAVIESRGLVTKNTFELLEIDDNETALPDLCMAAILWCRVRCFTDGAVIGSKAFVNGTFEAVRDMFTTKRKDGARRRQGCGGGAVDRSGSAGEDQGKNLNYALIERVVSGKRD